MSEARPGRPADATRTRTIADAKAHFAECVREVEAGRSIVLTRHGRAVARLVPIGDAPDEIAEPSAAYQPAVPTSPAPAARRATLRSFLDDHIWPRVPAELLGRGVGKRELEEILGHEPQAGTSVPKTPARDRRP